MTDEDPRSLLPAYGFCQWAMDLSGDSWLHPDGLQVVSTEAALAEIKRGELEPARPGITQRWVPVD